MREWTINFSNGREPLVVKGETLGKAIESYLVTNNNLSYADLSCTDLSNAKLSYAILSNADLRHADLSHAALNYADLSSADLNSANLMGADLSNAKLIQATLSNANLNSAKLHMASLRNAKLRNANLDYSCLPLYCGSLNIKIDKRIACQLLYHALRAMQSVVDEEVRAVLNDDKVLALANQFHRVAECGKIEKEKEKMTKWKPKVGEPYYFIDQCWKLKKIYVWENDDFDNQQYALGNVFQTYEEATQALEKLKEQFLSLHKDNVYSNDKESEEEDE